PLAVVANLEPQRPILLQRDRDRRGAARVLRGVLYRLEAAEVDRALDRLRVAADAVGLHVRRDRRLERRGLERPTDPPVLQKSGIDAACQPADLVERRAHVLPEP